ncbi:MAG TPA: LysM peptidoglycan-binding domain-containing protein [Actinomycetota bacterium]|nr:LysM peptidoglycan-binding domain-containing protein [Actinomycetota bacterium]
MNVLWGRVVVLAVVLLLVFLLGRATGGDSSELQALQDRVEAQNAEIDQLEAENRALQSPSPDPNTQTGTDGTGNIDGTTATPTVTPTVTPTATATATSRPTSTATPSPTSTAARTYTVRSGDNLGRIASREYGDASYAKCIQTANNITNPSALRVGQELTIPPKPAQPCT